MKFEKKNSLANVSWCRQEREIGGNSNDHWHVSGHRRATRAAPGGREHVGKSLWTADGHFWTPYEGSRTVQNTRERGNGRRVRRRAYSNQRKIK